jgi:predicted TIM-barrel fold metal-dependent hydrolase
MDKMLIVSADGHSAMPMEAWTEYLDKEHHKYLARLRNEKDMFCNSMQLLNDMMLSPEAIEIFDKEGVYRAGRWSGVWDMDVRLQEMDREGVAAEFVFPGDHRCQDLFWNTSNASYPIPTVDAGVRAWNRWCHDAFGAAADRLLLIGAPLSGVDLDALIHEAHWLADHGFTGMFTPGYCPVPGQTPVYDAYWDPLWSVCAERNLVLVTHAGWGMEQGFMFGEISAAIAEVEAEGGGDQELAAKLIASVFNAEGVFNDLRPRRGVWQFMLSGVFDRHPKLKMMVTEIRADWIPATFKLLDQRWEENRDKLPGKRRPSEYWGPNCMAGLSFMNKAEAEMRHEIGVHNMAFGRDYPHTEATWPNTLAYFSDIFRDVPEKEVRAILGENVIGFLGLDRAKLAAIAERIAPTYRQIAEGPGLEAALVDHLNIRCGYGLPAEGTSRIAAMEVMLNKDLGRIPAVASAR